MSASPSYINLGLTTSIGVSATAAGTYTVVVIKPDGITQTRLDYTFTQAGISTQIYGNSSIGFKSAIDQVGTYKVSLQTGGNEIAQAFFLATNKLDLDVSAANAGTTDNVCFTAAEFTRGTSIIPRAWVQYASTGEYVTPQNSPKATVEFTLPNGTKMGTRFAPYLPPKGAWRNCFRPDWNATAGLWNLVFEASDGKGNYGKYESLMSLKVGANILRIGYEILPAPLTVTAQVLDSTTKKPATTTLAAGQNWRIEVKAEYRHPLGPLGRESATGYLGLLNTTRGGVVTARFGWGFYNDTSNNFGGTDLAKNPGGLITTISLAYDRTTGLWIGAYPVTGSEPKGDYLIVIDAKDSASPPNSGTIKATLAPPSQLVTATVSTTVSVTRTTERLVETPVESITEVVPTWAYGAMVGLLVLGSVVGMFLRRGK